MRKLVLPLVSMLAAAAPLLPCNVMDFGAKGDGRAFIFEDATGSLDNVEIVNDGGQERAPVLVDKAGAIGLRGSSSGLKVEARSN